MGEAHGTSCSHPRNRSAFPTSSKFFRVPPHGMGNPKSCKHGSVSLLTNQQGFLISGGLHDFMGPAMDSFYSAT